MKKDSFSVVFLYYFSCFLISQECKALKTTPVKEKEVELKNVKLEPKQEQSLQFRKCSGFFLKK
jgi:hypothetical protein